MPAVFVRAPPVSRQLQFVNVDPLESEAILNVAADHGLGAREAAVAESGRASALRASIDQLEEVYAAVTAPDDRKRRRLMRAALKTRCVPVPSSALPEGTYWPVQATEADDRRIGANGLPWLEARANAGGSHGSSARDAVGRCIVWR